MDQSIFEIKNGILLYYHDRTQPEVIIPSTVTRIGDNTFQSLPHIQNVIIPDSVKRIGFQAFYQCINLRSITLSRNITCIEKETFAYCNHLESIVIPEGVTQIREEAFRSCQNLKKISIPKSVRKISNSAFNFCNHLTDISYHGISIQNDCFDYFGRHEVQPSKIFTAIDQKNFEIMRTWPKKLRYSVIWGMFISDADAETFKLVKGKFTDMFRYLIDISDAETIRKILDQGKLVKRGNIDKLIRYAIDKKAVEIQILLTNYKDQNIGYQSTEDIIQKKFSL